jgi:hypothetical protein
VEFVQSRALIGCESIEEDNKSAVRSLGLLNTTCDGHSADVSVYVLCATSSSAVISLADLVQGTLAEEGEYKQTQNPLD